MCRLDTHYAAPMVCLVLVGMIFMLPGETCQAQQQDPTVGEIMGFLELMEKYIILTSQLQSIAEDDVRTAGFSVLQLKNLYSDSGQRDKAISLFRDLMKRTANKAIKNLIGMTLADMLKEEGKIEESANVYRQLIEDNIR